MRAETKKMYKQWISSLPSLGHIWNLCRTSPSMARSPCQLHPRTAKTFISGLSDDVRPGAQPRAAARRAGRGCARACSQPLTALARLLDARPGLGRERLETFAAFVSDTLALRAAKTEHAIEQLHTSFRMADGALPRTPADPPTPKNTVQTDS